MRPIVALLASAVVVALAVPIRSDEPIASSVTFNREVIRIFQRKCLPCHVPGAVAMSFATYREARLWARGIREELIEQRMPPWRAAPGYGAFTNDIGLTPREQTMILTWADSGVPRGEDRDLPRRVSAAPPAAEPDLRLPLPPQRIPAGEEYVVRRVTVDAAGAAGRLVRQVQFVPGEKRALRAAFVSVLTDGPTRAERRVGAWTPWLSAVTPPDGAGFLVPAGAKLAVEMHYRGRDAELEDRSSLAFLVASNGAAAAGQVVVEGREGVVTLSQDTRVWAIFPELQPGSESSLEVSARKPDGATEVLLWIPTRHDDWPTPYVLRSPAQLPAGTVVRVTTAVPGRVVLNTLPGSGATDSPVRQPPR